LEWQRRACKLPHHDVPGIEACKNGDFIRQQEQQQIFRTDHFRVFSANGFKVFLFDDLAYTGIILCHPETRVPEWRHGHRSHNPKEYMVIKPIGRWRPDDRTHDENVIREVQKSIH